MLPQYLRILGIMIIALILLRRIIKLHDKKQIIKELGYTIFISISIITLAIVIAIIFTKTFIFITEMF